MLDKNTIFKALEAVKHNRPFALATIVESSAKGTPRKTGTKMIIYGDGQSEGTIGGGIFEKQIIKEAQCVILSQIPVLKSFDFSGHTPSSAICGGQLKVFIEPYIQQQTFIICGAGHIGLDLSIMIKMLGFEVWIVDNRESLCHKERFPHADKIIAKHPARFIEKHSVQPQTYIMIVTHDHTYDYECLEAAVKKGYVYIGVIGSQNKRRSFIDQLKKKGIKPKDIKKIHMPTGLKIGGQTPAEIAVSIAAEIVKVANETKIYRQKKN